MGKPGTSGDIRSDTADAEPIAEDAFQLSRELPESTDAEARRLRLVGDLAYEAGDLVQAEARYREAIEADPNGLRAHHNLGVSTFRQQNYDAALAAFEACTEKSPDVGELHFKTGLVLKQLGRPEDALLAFERAIERDSQHLASRYQAALLEAQGAPPASKRRDRAISLLESIVEAVDRGASFDGVDRVSFLLGSFLDDFPNRRDRAIGAYRRGLEADPLFAPGHNNLGVVLMQAGQTLPALGEFKIAIHLQPEYTLPYRNLAKLLFDCMSPAQMEQEFATITDEFGVQAAAVLSRLSLQLIDLGRVQVFESLYTHGHRIKNLMGLAGGRLRKLSRRDDLPGDLSEGLGDLLGEQERIYDQWVTYLRSMKPETFSPTLVDLPPLVSRAAEGVDTQRADAELVFQREERIPQIIADPAMLHEAIQNLILNAYDAVARREQGTGGATVTVQVGFDNESNSAFVEVEDNGPGISEALQARIFDPGFSTRDAGNGYGLSICARIVAAHRGTLRLVSRPGEGAVFRIDLPVDFEVAGSDDAIGLLRTVPEPARHPIAEEFIE